MEKNCLIIAGGEFAPVDKTEYDYVIACDKGYKYALEMGIIPDIIIGDFDSLDINVQKDIPVIRLPEIKDDTDTLYAIRYALDKGYNDITVCCALGGRFDHSIANIQAAAFILENDGKPRIIGKDTDVYMIKDSGIKLLPLAGSYISIFSYSEKCTGVTLRNLKYEITDAEITNSFPIGVSNEWKALPGYIEVKQGTLLIVISKK